MKRAIAMKRVLALMITAFVLLSSLGVRDIGVYAASERVDVTVTNVSGNIPSTTNDKITVKIKPTYLDDGPADKNSVRIEILDSSDFYPESGIFHEEDKNINLIYKGSGNRLDLKFSDGTFTATATAYLKTSTSSGDGGGGGGSSTTYKAEVVADGTNLTYNIDPGSTAKISVPIKNIGLYSLSNATGAISFEDTAVSFFKVEDMGNLSKIPTLHNTGKGTLDFTLRAESNIKRGEYPVTITVTSRDSALGTVKDTVKIYVKVGKELPSASITASSVDIPKVINAGDTFTIKADLFNTGAFNTESVKAYIAEDSFTTDGFTPDYITAQKQLGTIPALGTKSVSFNIKSSKDIKGGNHLITLVVDYKNQDGKEDSLKLPLYIQVASTDIDAPSIIVQNVKQDANIVFPGTRLNLTIDLKNIGDGEAKDLKIKLSGTDKDIMPTEVAAYKYISSLNSLGNYTLNYPLMISETIQSGVREMKLSVTYKDAEAKEHTEESTFYIINIRGKDEETSEASKPKLIINNYRTNPEILKAGSSFNFSFDFANMHPTKAVKNLKITFSTGDSPFVVKQGSNTFYVDEIAPGGQLTREIEFSIKPDALSKSFPLNISFDYEDDKGEAMTSTEVLNLQVVELSRVQVNEVNYPMQSYLGQMSYLSFEMYNMGKAPLNNVNVRVEGDFEASTSMLFIGNIEAGKGDMYDLEVTPTVAGDAVGVLVVTFEDSNGTEIVERREFTSTVMESFIDTWYPPMEPEVIIEEVKPLINPWLFAGIQVVLFGVATTVTRKVLIKRYVNKMRQED